MSRYLVLLALILTTPSPASAQGLTPPDVERVLLPITVQHSGGAFGSEWSTDLTVFIDADPTPLILPFTSCLPPPCDDTGGPSARHTLRLGFFPTSAGETAGSLMYVARSGADRVSLSLLLKHGGNNPGVALPVVREKQFFTSRFQLLDVPDAGSGGRLALRVYGIDPTSGGQVRVRILAEGEERLISQTTYDLVSTPRDYSTATFTVPVRPPVAEIHYWTPLAIPGTLLRFEIEPVTPGLRVWGFVSITDNATQTVSLRIPQ